MQQLRFILVAFVLVITFFLWQAWQKDYPQVQAPTVSTASVNAQSSDSYSLPALQSATPTKEASSQNAESIKPSATTALSPESFIHVRTDVLDVTIDTMGGNIVYSSLLKYPKEWNTPSDPVVLLNNEDATRYNAQSTLVGQNGAPESLTQKAQYQSEKSNYELQSGDDSITVKLYAQNDKGINTVKSYTFHRGSYAIDLNYAIQNTTQQPWQGNLYTQVVRKNNPPTSKGFFHTFFGASLSTPDESYKKITFKDMDKLKAKNQSIISNPVGQGGWVAMQEHYFLTAFVPSQSDNNHFYGQVYPDGLYAIGVMGPTLSVAPGANTETSTKLYVGPELTDQLTPLAPKLDMTVDYGWLWPISVGIFWLMKKIHSVVGNWGWSIVLVTILIKLVFYKLSSTSYRSMAKMKDLAPKIQSIKERYGDDRQKMSQATMELYKKEKVNPLGGCLPILVQIPFFIALYWVLLESVQLRQAPFILWIHDLSVMDPYYVLPILMGITMFVQQKLNPPPPDPTQAKVMMMLPIVFTVLFVAFPAGLVLYWVVNNTVSMAQQWYIARSVSGGNKK